MKTLEPKPSFKAVNEVRDAKAERKHRQAFYTPLPLVEKLVEWSDVYPSARCLEPSAGDGRIVHQIMQQGVGSVDACEIDTAMRGKLADMGANLVGDDFLAYNPGPIYDRIVMNPPFKGKTAEKHIEHAWELLKDGGKLLSIAPTSTSLGLDGQALSLPGCTYAVWESLGKDWFKDFGTNIEVIVVELAKLSDRETEGFCNYATYNAAITIQSDSQMLKLYQGKITTADALETALRGYLGKSICTVYGVNWQEVSEYLTESWGEPVIPF